MTVAPYLERPWDRNITITTQLVDTVEAEAARRFALPYYRCQALIAHRDKLDPILEACETFGRAGA